ncbi:MAG: thiol:disulfide interchange protein DsbG [Gammaproteobacteria bacterium]|nr:thiol:disulfide interchange protein DsbG [Gammaproteobacteria bacterium]
MLKFLMCATALFALPAVAASPAAPGTSDAPAALEYLLQQGLQVHTHFSTPGDLTGYVGTIPGGKQVVFFIPKDGSVAIFGTMLDGRGHNLSRAYLTQYQRGPLAAKTYQKLEDARWIAEGAKNPERIVYSFIDPDCPYCWHFWKAAQDYYDQGVQVRYIIVAILGKSSVQKAAAILAADDPGQAFRFNEEGFSHHSGAIEPMKDIPRKISEAISNNNALMMRFGFNGTPALVWKNDKGEVKTLNGLPPKSGLERIFGTRGKPDPLGD